VRISAAAWVGLLSVAGAVGACSGDGAKLADAAAPATSADAAADAPRAPDLGPDVELPLDLAIEGGGADDASGPEVGQNADASGPLCMGPLAGCVPMSRGMCDPVCQVGCGCRQRCVLAGGTPTCLSPADDPLERGARCQTSADACRPGDICLAEAEPACGAHCYRLCRRDADCAAGATCSIEIQFGASTPAARACSPPAEACDPTGEARCSRAGRPLPTFGCYVMSAEAPDSAVCDCAGTARLGEACQFEHECVPGLECVRVAGISTCRRVCRMGAAGGCPAGMACAPLGTTDRPSTVFGYCR
jgi:hypothetical protein